jgi:hypothetical protein
LPGFGCYVNFSMRVFRISLKMFHVKLFGTIDVGRDHTFFTLQRLSVMVGRVWNRAISNGWFLQAGREFAQCLPLLRRASDAQRPP